MIDLTATGDEIITVERAEPWPSPPRLEFERLLPRPERNTFLAWAPPPATLLHYRLRDVVLDGSTMVLLRRGKPIRQTTYLIDEARIAAIPAPSGAGGFEGKLTLIGSNAIHRNYFHWLIQAVPAIDAAVRRNLGHPVRLALPPETHLQRDSLALLGHADIPRLTIEPDRQYRLAEAEYSGFLEGAAIFAPCRAQAETFHRLRASVKLRHKPRDRIYVARTDAPVRRMQNEAALVECLRARGFEIVLPGTMSLREQISRFRHAGLVVGPHGAGLSNIVFCEPGTIVYELVPALYQNSCFTLLADITGLRYWADVFASQGAVAGFTGDWAVDIDDVLRRIDDIERIAPAARLPRLPRWLTGGRV